MKAQIQYEWWRDDKAPISDEHQDTLKQEALERIHSMAAQGYQSGQLLEEIDGVAFSGWWRL